jgi:predicted nucleic acid-binding protein
LAATDVIIDASFLVSVWFEDEEQHEETSSWYARETSRFVTTPVVVAEMDYMVRKYGGDDAARVVIANLATLALEVDWWDDAVRTCWKLVDTRPEIGIADASLVALAAHRNTTQIATLDERHFRTLAPLTGEPSFTLLPADAD